MNLYSYLSVFDLDKTLVRVNSAMRYYFYKKDIDYRSMRDIFISFARYRFGSISPWQLHREVFFSLLEGKRGEDFFSSVEDFWEKNFSRFLYHPAIQRLEEDRKRGHYILLLSNAPEFIVAPVAKKISADSFSSSRYQYNTQGKFTQIATLMDGENKAIFAKRVAEKIGAKKMVAYTDSVWDLPLLEVADQVVAVSPDKKLKKISLEKGWEII